MNLNGESSWHRVGRLACSLVGAVIAALFARASITFFLRTHSAIGLGFFIQQIWIAAAFLLRRAPRLVSRRWGDWLLAFAGTFVGVLLRPAGLHTAWGVGIGSALQMAGLVVWTVSYLALGRSFGFVAADRGLVTRGPYAFVRHPVYASYIVTQFGYVLQSLSAWNVGVLIVAATAQIGRALAEEKFLMSSPTYAAYRARVRWRLVPWIW
jgi:protein-S-isoprenylcysteine O-methyltransferase Ste14